MNKIKKYLCTIIAFVMLFILTACGGGDGNTTTVSNNDTYQSQSSDIDNIETELTQTNSSEINSSEINSDEATPNETSTTAIIDEDETSPTAIIDEDGTYTTKDDVALYIYTYGHLPSNFITKKDAEKLGWSGGSLEPYAEGKCIGGSRFGNFEGILPEKDGRTYTECDIDTLGADKRGAKRIVFSNDGIIYYTEDHYETFELLYGEE
jgi:hypothetical protein